MLVDPDFIAELDNQYGQQTIAFVKRVMKALLYVEATADAGVLTCQVKTGDGVNHAAITDVSVRTIATAAIPPLPQSDGLISVDTGTVQAGGGSQACWLKTLANGTFQVTVTGIGNVLVELVPQQGVAMFVTLSL